MTTLIIAVSFSAYSNGQSSIKIGNQVWATTNLNVTTYSNGDPIPEVKDPSEWKTLTTGAWCYYNNDPANGTKYGKLYNWYAVHDPRGLAPAGFHIPSDAEWTTLITYLGGESVAGGKLKQAGMYNWISPNTVLLIAAALQACRAAAVTTMVYSPMMATATGGVLQRTMPRHRALGTATCSPTMPMRTGPTAKRLSGFLCVASQIHFQLIAMDNPQLQLESRCGQRPT